MLLTGWLRRKRRRSGRYRYLLGRLGGSKRPGLRAQAKLWDPVAEALFDRAGIRRGARVLEVGPGQGLAAPRAAAQGWAGRSTLSSARRSSPRRLRSICRRDGLGDGQIWESDLLHAPLPRAEYDFIFARWVFLFLPILART